jgi:carboxypeptidase Taq
MSPLTTARDRFGQWMATLYDLHGVSRLLDWDRETLMPAEGAEGRGQQVGTLRAVRHSESLRDGVDEDMALIEAQGDPSDADRAMIALARHERERARRVPESLVRAHGEAQSAGLTAWLANREAGDFAAFAPALTTVVALTREIGEALQIGAEPYDGLLDDYEPGTTTAELEALLGDLGPKLAAIVAGAAPTRPTTPFAGRDWPDAAQLAVGEDIARMVGFDMDGGLIARSAHPFTDTPHRGDVRFTTRIAPDDPSANVLVTLHEAGHALYAQGLPAAYARTLLYASASLGADESQSRFFENHVGRRLSFWEHVHPTFVARFGASMDGLGPQDMVRAITRVQPGWCRVDADEVTYDLHIILRFELELALIRGSLTVADLPGAWREASQRLLGVTPSGDAEGCMQDIHWAWGMFGYFPTYTLGNIYAAQLAEALEATEGPIDDLIRAGRLDVVLRFMRTRVHNAGCCVPTRVLMERATGGPFNTDPFLRRVTQLAANG